MERKTIVGICYFLIVLFVAQEQVVEIEAYCEKLSRFFFDACNGPIAEEQCSLICHDKENSLGGSCINQKCICYA
ncbi:hypothetical protein P8452_73474 [Trifolium repens]|nr:hypothetical protein P8452_73474 [Trifolium repens]